MVSKLVLVVKIKLYLLNLQNDISTGSTILVNNLAEELLWSYAEHQFHIYIYALLKMHQN